MNNIKSYTTEQLEAELERRREIENNLPIPLSLPDFSQLKKRCEKYIQELANDELDDDIEHFIFKNAMEAFYGENVWIWINEKMR